ncbi:MAG: serine protease [Phycisphaerae bacterium]|nr:serine protease [Phycisphaerae bacterium]
MSASKLILTGLLGIFLVAAPAAAVVIRGGDGTGNTSAPAADPGWANVGQRGVGSAVYLGNNWVMTAAHVGAGSVNFGGTDYSAVAGSSVRLHAPGSPGELVDIIMFRIEETPDDVVDLTISSSRPSNGSDVVAIGCGRNREADQTWWNSSWEEQQGSAAYRGFEYDAGREKRWGENDIDGTSTIDVGYGSTRALRMDFDRYGGQGDDEMQLVDGDSGGGLFYYNSSTGNWELSGMLMARSIHSGQPYDTAVYGNRSYAADLSWYDDQIGDIITTPEPATLLILTIAAPLLLRQKRRR